MRLSVEQPLERPVSFLGIVLEDTDLVFLHPEDDDSGNYTLALASLHTGQDVRVRGISRETVKRLFRDWLEQGGLV